MATTPNGSSSGTNYVVSAIIALLASGAITVVASSLAFSGLTNGTNTQAAMVVGTGGSLAATGSGTIAATSVTGLSVTAGKTATFDHSSTFTTTDGQTYTFPTTSATLARTDAANTFTGHQTIEGVTSTGATGTGAIVFGTSPTINTDPITATVQHLTENAQTDNYTLALGDDYKIVTLNNAGSKTLSINTDAAVAFPVGTSITVVQKGAGQYTISATNSGTTTIVSNGGTAAAPKLRVQYSSATLWKDATNHWYVFGDIQ